jgi:prenyltransferase beta subunit
MIRAMRQLAWLLAISSASASAQSPQAYIKSLYVESAGAFKVTPDGKPGLRATSGAVRALQYLGETDIPNQARLRAFVLSCYDPRTGAFAEPDGKPDVTITSVGVMACFGLAIDKARIAKSMDYLRANAKSFEDVRISAAAVELFKSGGAPDPFDLDPWFRVAEAYRGSTDFKAGGARSLGSHAAFRLRLGRELDDSSAVSRMLRDSQRSDGGWGKTGENASDLETTYRVMRALKHLKTTPDSAKLSAYLQSCRNADGGSSVVPGGPSTMSGTYYAAAIAMWMKSLESGR